ncbi:MAG TPA: transglutaminase family protein [Opitutaceae bacterium]|jgi:transglutaminase-like putative cysteine protease
MRISVGCTLRYQVMAPSADFTVNVLVNADAEQQLVSESIACSPEAPMEIVTIAKGERVLRTEARIGPFDLRYAAVVDVNRPQMPPAVPADQPGRLPLSILTYTLPSRYCESDRFGPIVWDLFGRTDDRAEQVRSICRWVDENVAYAPGSTDGRTSAWDVWQGRKGVCRDYTHLSIAFCRALSIPARYVGGYGVGLVPMNFHACFEAYLGGRWRLFDPTDSIDSNLIVAATRGRDAASAGLTTIFGKVAVGPIEVACELAEAQSAGIRIE